MDIEKIDPARLRNDGHFQFMTEVNDLVYKTGAAYLRIESEYADFVLKYTHEDDTLKVQRKSVLTKNIHALDRARDDALLGLIETNTAVLKRHHDPVMREHARKLDIGLANYGKGNVTRKTINEETSAVHNLLQDLNTTLAASVAALGLTSWVIQLRNCNAELDNLVKERYDEDAAKSEIRVKEARVASDTSLHNMLRRIEAYNIIEGPEHYDIFIRTLNVIIAKYKTLLHRHHHRHRDEEDSLNPDTPDEQD